MKNYYQILGVSYTATAVEIKKVYRKLAVQYHPDKNPDPQAEALFKEINEAYDVLSDPEKRSIYNLRLVSPLLDVPAEPPQPAHRDPRYRRRRPADYPRPEPKPSQRQLMQQYLPYIKWICWPGLVVTILFAVDYFLPYSTKEEKIISIYDVRGRRGDIMYHTIRTESGRKIKVYDGIGIFMQEPSIKIRHTLIYSTVMEVSDHTGLQVVSLGYVYGAIVFLPVVLFITSILSILFRHNVEFVFNVSLVSAMLLIINLILIL